MQSEAARTNQIYYGWVIVALATMMQAITSGSTNALYGVFAVPFSDSFDASRTAVLAATASVAMIFSGLLSPFAGHWLGKHSPKAMILFGGLVLMLGFAALTQARSLWQVSVIYALCWSTGNTLYGTLAANTSVSNWFVVQRGKALGIAAIGISIGSFCLPPLVSWVIVDYGWRTACAFLALMIGTSLPFIWRWYRNTPEDIGLRSEPEPAIGNEGDNWKDVLKNRHFWLIGICVSICFAGFNGLLVNLIPMAIDQNVDPKTAAFLLSTSAFFGVIGKITVGFSADRLGPRLALTLPLLTLICACALLWGAPDFQRMILAACFIGLSSGGSIPVWGALIGSYFGRKQFSLVMGMMNPMLVPLIVACAPYVSWTKEHSGTYNPALLTIIGAVAVAVTLLGFLKPLKSAH